MSGLTLNFTGIDKALANINTKKFKQEIQDELNSFGLDVVRDAKALAPVDEGHLKGAIEYKSAALSITITVGVDYAAYVEFGTRKYAAQHVASLPAEWQEFASQSKGAGGGSFDELVMNIVRWVKAKGIGATFSIATHKREGFGKQSAATTDDATAYAIAKHIIIVGIQPHPFLYPAFEKNRIELIKRLKSLL